jgi:hypothetical protein
MVDQFPVVYRQRGRPSEFTTERGTEICERLANGESLRSICRDESMPSVPTVTRWLFKFPEFHVQYALARARQAELWADDIIAIADNPVMGTVVTEKPTGVETRHGDMIEHRKLQIDARKWIAARILPKKYGAQVENGLVETDKPAITISGGLPD